MKGVGFFIDLIERLDTDVLGRSVGTEGREYWIKNCINQLPLKNYNGKA